jgi:hypothetical protein
MTMRTVYLLAMVTVGAAASPPRPGAPLPRPLQVVRGGGVGDSLLQNPELRQLAIRPFESSAHLLILFICTRKALESIRLDQWAAIRGNPAPNDNSILKQRRWAARVTNVIGTGYTPRITFLAGMMLRSVQMATNLRYVFDPSLGFAAGAALGASFGHREWLKCVLLGWGVGGAYWGLFRVRPPISKAPPRLPAASPPDKATRRLENGAV